MKYLCVGYLDPVKINALPKARLDEVMSECPPHMEALYRSGKIFTVAGVDQETKSLRRVGGKVQVTDGPAKGSKERIGCVFLVEATDMADAIRVASLHPTTQIGAGEALGWRIEIQPVNYFDRREVKTGSRATGPRGDGRARPRRRA